VTGDLDGNGRAARVDGQRNTAAERRTARRWCAAQALTTPKPHTTLAELLDQLDLNPKKGEPR
jgi:sulfur carrier protein ThiS